MIKGVIKMIGETKSFGANNFQKREFVVTDDSNTEYPQHILLEMTKDNCVKLDNFKVGDRVQVEYFLNGREWTNPENGQVRYFNSLQAWKIESELTNDELSKHGFPNKGEAQFVPDEDDLPF